MLSFSVAHMTHRLLLGYQPHLPRTFRGNFEETLHPSIKVDTFFIVSFLWGKFCLNLSTNIWLNCAHDLINYGFNPVNQVTALPVKVARKSLQKKLSSWYISNIFLNSHAWLTRSPFVVSYLESVVWTLLKVWHSSNLLRKGTGHLSFWGGTFINQFPLVD